MRALFASLAALGLLLAACTPVDSGAGGGAPARTADIKRSKLDIAYTALLENDVHKVSSRKVLTEALTAVKTLAKENGGSDDVAIPTDLQDVNEPVLADFRKFADAVNALALKNPRLAPDQIADTVLRSYTRSSPDCHTYYVPKRAAVPASGVSAVLPPAPPSLLEDEAGLESKLLPSSIGYITWHEFVKTGTYDITTEVKRTLDKLLGQGAKGWIFDLRGNVGGDPPQVMASWFLSGQPTITFMTRTGSAGTQTAIKEFRLPDAYQLPLAIILNNRGGSSPEVLTLALKEHKRAIVVGQRSVGCLGSISPLNLPDGSFFAVAGTEFVGGVTGARYNNVGIPPDVPADDAGSIDAAVKAVQDALAKGVKY